MGRTGLRDGLDWAAGEARVQSGVGLKALTRAPRDGYGGLGLYFKTKWPRRNTLGSDEISHAIARREARV